MNVNHKELKEQIKICYETKTPLFIWGTTGIGKSTAVEEITKEIAESEGLEFSKEDIENGKFGFVDIRISQLEPSDLRGLPDIDREKQRTKWLIPDWLPKNPDSKGIIFFDELNLSPPSIQATAYQLILDRRLGDYILPKGWVIISAGNRVEDKCNVFEMSSALCNRFTHTELMIPDKDLWLEWALKNDIDGRIIAFLQFKPSDLFKFEVVNKDKAFPTPRCIKENSKILMEDGTKKEIKDVKIGEKVIGFENGQYVISKVLNKFKKKINKQYEIRNNNSKLTTSGEHRFLTDLGYVQAKHLNKNIPTYMYGKTPMEKERNRIFDRKLSKNDKFSNSKEIEKNRKINCLQIKSTSFKEMEHYTKDFNDTDGVELFSRFDRWGWCFIHRKKDEERKKDLLRTSITNPQLFGFILRLVKIKRFFNNQRNTKGEKLSRQICSKSLWFWNERVDKIINTILNNKETESIINEGIYKRKNETNKREKSYRNKKINVFEKNFKTFELKAKAKTISIRKTNNSEIFYDLMTSSKNYIANDFIVHNSWAFCSRLIKDKTNKNLLNILVGSAVGEATANEFVAFLRLQNKIDLQSLLKNPKQVAEIKEIDLKYVLLGTISEYYRKDKKLLVKCFDLCKHLEPEFSALLLRFLKGVNPNYFSKTIIADKKGKALLSQYSDVLR